MGPKDKVKIGNKPMRVLVTGGMGFIGSHFVRHLIQSFPDLTAINLDKLTYAGNPANLEDLKDEPRHVFVKGDILDTTLLAGLFHEHHIDAVVHLAAESHVDRSILAPKEFIDTNVSGTLNLLSVALKSWESRGLMESARFVHVSTDEVYGSLGFNDPPAGEDARFTPNSPYAASKAAGDHLARSFHRTYGLPVVITNSTNNYGPFQFPEKLIPLTITRIMEGKAVPIYGRGRNVRDWLYVEDHCRALALVLFVGRPGDRYNVSARCELTNLELVEEIASLMDARTNPARASRELITFVEDRPGHDLRYGLDSLKIARELGWRPQVDITEGLSVTIDWYLENRAWIEGILSGDYLTFFEKWYGKRL